MCIRHDMAHVQAQSLHGSDRAALVPLHFTALAGLFIRFRGFFMFGLFFDAVPAKKEKVPKKKERLGSFDSLRFAPLRHSQQVLLVRYRSLRCLLASLVYTYLYVYSLHSYTHQV